MYCTPQEVREVGTQITPTAGPTPWPDEVLLKVIERASRMFDMECGVNPEYFEPALYPVWQSLHAYAVGDIVTPTTPNAHKYRVTTAGTSGASEPVFPTSSAATVTNGSVVFTENGADVLATALAVYGDGSNYLRLPPYVPGTLVSPVTVPSGYTAQEGVERDGYLVRSESGVLAFGSSSYGWHENVAITVTAKWGYEAVPADVKHAVIELVINLVKETDPASIKMMNLDNQPLRERLPPRVSMIASKYKYRGAVLV